MCMNFTTVYLLREFYERYNKITQRAFFKTPNLGTNYCHCDRHSVSDERVITLRYAVEEKKSKTIKNYYLFFIYPDNIWEKFFLNSLSSQEGTRNRNPQSTHCHLLSRNRVLDTMSNSCPIEGYTLTGKYKAINPNIFPVLLLSFGLGKGKLFPYFSRLVFFRLGKET